MEKQTESQRIRETRKIIVISEETRREIDAIILGSMGRAPAKERLRASTAANLANAYCVEATQS